MNEINVKNSSGDREYFTIIPNYILNHSTAIDQALYMQMKRVAGDGQCAVSIRYLQKQLKIGRTTIYKSIKYLVTHGWIKKLGKIEVRTTKRGVQKVNCYEVVDLWELNTKYYVQRAVDKSKQRVPNEEHIEPTCSLNERQRVPEMNHKVRSYEVRYKKNKKITVDNCNRGGGFKSIKDMSEGELRDLVQR